jgi:hypothetical protein
MTQPGIDMAHSGWGNPDHHPAPAPRPVAEVPPADDVCEMAGPGGWACENKPGHRGEHWADTGARKTYWTTDMVETTTVADLARGEQTFIPGRSHVVDPEREPGIPGDVAEMLHEVAVIATKALASQSPAAWAVALDKILEVARNA